MTPRPGAGQGHGLDGFYTALRRPGIVRQSNGRWFAGVAAGVARWLGVDPLVVRAGFILFSIFFGMGLALYLVLWLLMPDERGEIHVERALKHGEGGSIFLLVVTVIAVLGGGPWWGGDTRGFRFFGFALLVVGAWWFLTRTGTGRELMAQAPWKNQGAPARRVRRPVSTRQPVSRSPSPLPARPPHTPAAPATAYGSTGNAAANVGATLAAPRPPAPTPVRERTPSIGFAGGLLVLGLAIVTGVVMSTIAQAAGWSGHHVAIGIASGVGMLGLGILVAGIAGRRSGGLAFFAVTGMIAAAATTAAPVGLSQPWQAGRPQLHRHLDDAGTSVRARARTDEGRPQRLGLEGDARTRTPSRPRWASASSISSSPKASRSSSTRRRVLGRSSRPARRSPVRGCGARDPTSSSTTAPAGSSR